jgi:hypothetical protein
MRYAWGASRVLVRSILACETPAIIVSIFGLLYASGSHNRGIAATVSGVLELMMLSTSVRLILRGAVLGLLIGLGFRWARQGT